MDIHKFIYENSYFPLHKTHFKTEKSYKKFDKGIVFYEETDKFFIVAGDPVCSSKTNTPKVLDEFVKWAHSKNKHVCGYYFSDYIAQKTKGMKASLAGVSLENNLDSFSIEGKESKEIRRAINYSEKHNLKFEELSEKDYFELFFELKNLESIWYKKKKNFKKIKFLLSSLKINPDQISERNFIVKCSKGKVLSFASLDSFNEKAGRKSFYLDHMLMGNNSYKLSLDFLISKIILLLKEENHSKLDLGFCPFKGIKPSGLIESGMYVSKYINYLYNSRGVYNYKKKFSTGEKPVYLLLDPCVPDWKQLLSLANATFV